MSLKPFKPQGMWSLDQQIGSSGNKQHGFWIWGQQWLHPFFSHKITFIKFKLTVQCQSEKFLEGHSLLGFLYVSWYSLEYFLWKYWLNTALKILWAQSNKIIEQPWKTELLYTPGENKSGNYFFHHHCECSRSGFLCLAVFDYISVRLI